MIFLFQGWVICRFLSLLIFQGVRVLVLPVGVGTVGGTLGTVKKKWVESGKTILGIFLLNMVSYC